MTHQSFAIYTESLDSNSSLVKFITDYCSRLGDVILITDSLDTSKFQHYPIFPSFYIRYFPGNVIFLNMEDYLEYKDYTIGKSVIFVDPNNPIKFDRSLISKDNLFIIQ